MFNIAWSFYPFLFLFFWGGNLCRVGIEKFVSLRSEWCQKLMKQLKWGGIVVIFTLLLLQSSNCFFLLYTFTFFFSLLGPIVKSSCFYYKYSNALFFNFFLLFFLHNHKRCSFSIWKSRAFLTKKKTPKNIRSFHIITLVEN